MRTPLSLNVAVAVALSLFAICAAAKETGVIRADAELKAAPYSDANSAGALAANTRVDVFERRGAWLRVAVADKNGWLRLHQLRLGEGPEKQGSTGLTQLWSVGQTGRSGTQGIVATTGIRGMTATQLTDAKPNRQEVEKLNQFRANETQARELAGAAGLKERDIAALPNPEAAGGGAPVGSSP